MSTPQNLDEITAADVMQTDVTTIPATMPLEEVEQVLSESDITGAPVTDHAGRIAGVISLRDLVGHLTDEPEAGRPPGYWSEALEGPAARPRGGAVGPEPEGRLGRRGAGGGEEDELPDLPDEQDRSERLEEEFEAGLGQGSPAGQERAGREEAELERMATGESVPPSAPATAENVMTAEVHSVAPATPLREIAGVMVDRGIHRVLVGSDGRFVGIVTSTDVLRALAGRDPAPRARG